MLAPRVTVALVLVQVFFGVHYLIAKRILMVVPPRAWACIRIATAALVLLFAAHGVRRAPRPSRALLAKLSLYAIFGIVLNQILFVEGLARTTPSHSAIINSLIPVLTLGFAILLGRERASFGRLGAIALALGSVLVLLRIESFRLHDEMVRGDLLTFANGASFSLFLVLSRRGLRGEDPWVATAWLMTLGAAGILAVGGAQLARVPWPAVGTELWLMMGYAIVFATVLTYFLNYWALRHAESSMVALFIYLQPPIATGLSMAILHERPGPRFWIAAAGIFAAVYLAVRAERRPGAAFSRP